MTDAEPQPAPRPAPPPPFPVPGRPACRFCGAPLDPHQAVRRFCGKEACEREYMAELTLSARLREQERLEQWRRDMRDKAPAEIAAAADALGVASEDAVLAVTPFLQRAAGPLPEERRRDFLEHLRDIVAEGFAEPLGPDDAPDARRESGERPEAGPLDACCATCRGACCAIGASTNAFLTGHDVRRLRARNPEITPDEALAAYADRLPDRSMLDSCVYHTETGCALTREIRADICNSFHCTGQAAMMTELREGGPKPVVIAAQVEGEPRNIGAYDAPGGWRHVLEMPPAEDG